MSQQEPAVDPREVVALLADDSRMRAFAAVALGAESLADVAAAGGLEARAATRALAKLAAGGLVDGGPYRYRVRLEALRDSARETAVDPGRAEGSLGRFIQGGRLIAWPASREDRLRVLEHLAGLFEPGRRYAEPEVNETLAALHDDHAAMRRYLVDEGLLARAHQTDSAGRTIWLYWRT